jgi:hypothetical protein
MIGLRSPFPRPGRKMEPVMSVQPRPWPQPAPEIVVAVAAMYRGKRERPLAVMVRDQLGEWLADEQFAGAYGVRGKPGWPPGRLALVTVRAENLVHVMRPADIRGSGQRRECLFGRGTALDRSVRVAVSAARLSGGSGVAGADCGGSRTGAGSVADEPGSR